MMDWYLAPDGGDLVVPKDREYFDRLPSPDSWSQWGNGEFGNMDWRKKLESEKITDLPEGDFEISQHEGNQCSFGSSIRGLSFQDSFLGSSDPYTFGDLMEADTTDTIFMSSLLQDESTSMMYEYQIMSSDPDVMRNLKSFRIPSSAKLLDTLGMLPSDSTRYDDEDSTDEESVLLGLEAVMSQLSDRTRLCFRDSLYRLAHRSMQQLSEEAQVEEALSLDMSPALETTDEQTSSAGTTGNAESTTNTIDRAVADLMFNNANVNLQERLLDTSAKTFPNLLDSEVPIFRQQNPESPNSSPSSCDA